MTYARTTNLELVRGVATHASQIRMSSEDATRVATWSPTDDDRVYFLTVRDGGEESELYGVVTLLPQNSICFELHVAFLPVAWGKTRPALAGAIAWAWRETPARRIVASIPRYNRLAIKLARDVGMTQFGTNAKSFLKNGILHDQILLGISPKE